MKFRTNAVSSFEIISYYTGYVVLCTALLMIIPIITALVFAEWNAMLDFLISMAIAALVGIALAGIGWRTKQNRANIQWKHGFVIAALSWFVLMILCAIPYCLI